MLRTAEQTKKYLSKHLYYQMFIRNATMQSGLTYTLEERLGCTTVRNSIAFAFIWMDTPEENDFWRTLSKGIREVRTISIE